MGANNTLIGSSAGANITSGNNNIAIGATTNMVSATASNQLNIGNWIYGSGGNIGIGITTPLTRLHISSGSGGVSGVRLHDLVATSPIYGGLATPIGVDGSGNIVNTVAGNIPVYTGLGASTSSSMNNSTNPPTIGADYNKYFTLPVRQSFVVTDVGGQPANAPNFAVNGATNKCSGGGCQTPWATYMMSAQNSITASSRYAYQIMISDRVDAPFVVRGGTYYNSTQDIMNTAGTVSALWFKALTVPTNHSEYFYVNPGVDQNNNPISGGGNVGLGTAYPDLQFVVAENTATNRIMQIKRGTQ